VPFIQDRLTRDPAYNVQLGSQYLADMLQRFGGSYEIALAAYNAGPNRVARWLETMGDPRGGKIDMVDWIEMIPLRETRNYVQRIMEGVGVYRDRLSGPFRTLPPAMGRSRPRWRCRVARPSRRVGGCRGSIRPDDWDPSRHFGPAADARGPASPARPWAAVHAGSVPSSGAPRAGW
jgi:hypothetical protein